MRWVEGPVYFPEDGYLLFSDIPNNRMLRWDEQTGQVCVFRQPSNYANGNTRDQQGRLITCEHGTRRVTRTEHDGSITVLMDSFNGKQLNAPNDVVVAGDGAIWFTDPGYGSLLNYEGFKADLELPTNVYRLDPAQARPPSLPMTSTNRMACASRRMKRNSTSSNGRARPIAVSGATT